MVTSERQVRGWLAVIVMGCGATPAAPVVGPPDVVVPEPASETDPPREEMRALLIRIANLSCHQQVRCRSYVCSAVGTVAEVCHPDLVAYRVDEVARDGVSFDRVAARAIIHELSIDGSCRDQRLRGHCEQGINRIDEAVVGKLREGQLCDTAYACSSRVCARGDGRYGERTKRCSAPTDERPRPLPDGETCAWTRDCRKGRVCSSEEGCELPLPRGAPCGDFLGPSQLSRCADGLVCTSKGCADGLPVGAECQTDSSGEPCSHGTICRSNPVPEGPAQTCQQLVEPGASCDAIHRCPEWFRCVDAKGDSISYAGGDLGAHPPQGTCEPLSFIGGVCRSNDDCALGECVGQRCEPGAKGSSCLPHDHSLPFCAKGLSCSLDTNTCEPMLVVGETCTYDYRCQSGSCHKGQCELVPP